MPGKILTVIQPSIYSAVESEEHGYSDLFNFNKLLQECETIVSGKA